MLLPVVRLSPQERDAYLRAGGVGDGELGCRKSADSDSQAATMLAARLSQLPPPEVSAVDPLIIHSAAAPNAWPRVEVSHPQLLTPRLIAEVHGALQEIAVSEGGSHQIEICDALGWLESPFHVFVERDVVYVFADDSNVLSALGLAGEQIEFDA